MAIPHFKKIVDDSFGLWITGFFSAISAHNPLITFEQHKQYFFEALAILLETGRAKFIHPEADCYISPNHKPKLTINDPEAHWNAPTNEIMHYLKSKWPEHAASENDLQIALYLHEIPGIIWKDQNGLFVGS